MGHPLGILVLGLISVSQLWEGVQCNDYRILAPDFVCVEKGLCVTIPCYFTYPQSEHNISAPLYGYWYGMDPTGAQVPLLATNNRNKEIAPSRRRFHLSEKVEEGNCSLFITDVQHSDQHNYFFSMQKGGQQHNYLTSVNVTVREASEPEILIMGKLRAGQPVNLTCAALSCSSKSSQISWELSRNISRALLPYGKYLVGFVPTEADDGQFLTCRVIHGSECGNPVIREKRIYLNVSYAPQTPRISVELNRPNKSSQYFTDTLQIEVREGDTLQLCCKAEGNPLPRVTLERSRPTTQHSVSVDQLTLHNVTWQDVGEYTCWAQNSEGTSRTTFQVYMAENHVIDERTILLSVLGFFLVKVLFCSLILSCVIRFSNQRKPAVMGG